MSLRTLCEDQTNLSSSDISLLETLEASLQATADLTDSDIFLDCLIKDKSSAIVIAEANPRFHASAYKATVAGMYAFEKNEPAVFHSFASGMPMRDLKAVTQENKTVKQDVLPIFNQNREIIAVLIREKDISKSILEAKKYKKLEKDKEKTNNILLSLPDADTPNLTAMREIHHRVKNNLQMVASILNLQSRKTDNPEVKRAFKENTTRVLSIAAIHDILTNINQGEEVSLKPLLEKIRRNVQSVSGCDTVLISIAGDDICLSVDKATSVALVVNELLSNALEHAFPFEKKGHILIRLQDGALYGSISVEDDGEGFDSSADHPQSLGLAIVSMTVKDKLKGELRISSSSLGTKAMFDFKK